MKAPWLAALSLIAALGCDDGRGADSPAEAGSATSLSASAGPMMANATASANAGPMMASATASAIRPASGEGAGPMMANATASAGAGPMTANATASAGAGPMTANATASAARPASGEGATQGDMALLPAGVFLMGAYREYGSSEEKPAHEAIVPGFWLDRREATVAEFRACVDAGRCTPSAALPFCNGHVPGRERHPINCIDLRQAALYCAWAQKRLPSEREWEYAASGGTERRRYSWGNAEPTSLLACYYHPGTCEVGSFPAGAFGLYDMTGNVWEWTQSEFLPFPSRPGLDAIADGKL